MSLCRIGSMIIRQRPGVFVIMSARSSSAGPIADQIDTWKKAHELFNSKERDLERFPREGYGDFTPAVRLGFIPEKAFQFFYEKTGVTGPYMLGIGALTYLLSKEVWVLNHGFAHFLSFWLMVACIQKFAGPALAKYLDKDVDLRDDAMYYQPIRGSKRAIEKDMDKIDQVIDQNENKSVVPEIKKENILLILEAVYRERLHQVHKDVKSRLDYQLEKQNARARFERDHMMNWIVNNVLKSISPQQEKDALQTCISSLAGLSKTVKL